MIYEVPHRKLQIEQHPPYYKSTNIWQRGQTMIYEAPQSKLKIYEVPHRKLKIEQRPPYYKSTNIWQRGQTMIYEAPHRKLRSNNDYPTINLRIYDKEDKQWSTKHHKEN